MTNNLVNRAIKEVLDLPTTKVGDTVYVFEHLKNSPNKKKKRSLRYAMNLPIGTAIFQDPSVVDAGLDGDVGEMFAYGKQIDEILKRNKDTNELYDIQEDMGMDEMTEKLIDSLLTKWAALEFSRKKLHFDNSRSEQKHTNIEFNKIDKQIMDTEDRLHDLLMPTDITFYDAIQKGKQYLRKAEDGFSRSVPEYKEWSIQDSRDNDYGIDEGDKYNHFDKFGSKKYKVFVLDSKTGDIREVNYGAIKTDEPKKTVKKPKSKRPATMDKSIPKYHTGKFWHGSSVSKIISEIINPKDIDTASIQMHSELNPEYWEGDKLRPEIRQAFLKNVLMFVESLKLPNFKAKDIIFTGSMANYNYTENSDADIHLLVDFKEIDENEDLVREFFLAKKAAWGDKIIKIRGHEVETFVQDTNEPTSMSSAYSIHKDEWLEKPMKNMIELDKEAIEMKASSIMNAIDKLEHEADPDIAIQKIDSIRNKLRKMRSSGLHKEGDFSLENLTFKVIRTAGYLDKLKELKNKYLTDALSLNENLKP